MRSSVLLLLSLALLPLSSTATSAQSLLASRGLGLVVSPTDARGQALGGTALGLIGDDYSWANPADAVGLPAPGLRVAFQFDQFEADLARGEDASGSTARFPLIQGAFPIGERWAVSLGFGGFLDQNWAVQRDDTLRIGPDTAAVQDRLSSEGGVARLRLGAGYRVVQGVSVGLGVDAYLGSVRRSFGRLFPGELEPGCCRTQWNYSGVGAVAGVEWSPTEALNVAIAGTSGGRLTATAQDSLSTDEQFDLPATLQAGASGRVAGGLVATLSGEWAGWSTLNDRLASVGGARDSRSLRGGVEYEGLAIAGRTVPLRVGARHQQLPFQWEQDVGAEQWVTERALTAGLGAVLAGGATRADLALERGQRGGDGAGISESFWRVGFSVSVLGR